MNVNSHENLKIVINLESPVLINRFSTIDSLLLALAVSRKFGKTFPEGTDLLNEFDFLAKDKDGFTGSIWFVEKDAEVLLENKSIVKKSEYDYLNANRLRPIEYNQGGGEFKLYNIWHEVMSVKSIYYYARGDKEEIVSLLNDLKYVGKKGSIGYGKVTSFSIETIDKDKSVMLFAHTPSRPLSVKNYSLDNDRIAYFNAIAPYWKKSELEACYMPNSSLTESLYVKLEPAKLADKKYFEKYKSATSFAYDVLHNDTKGFSEVDYSKKLQKKDRLIKKADNESYLCVFSAEESNEGILCDNLEKSIGDTFTDYAYAGDSKFISKEALWTLQNAVNNKATTKTLGFHLIDEKGITYVMGKLKTKTIKQALSEAKPPYNFALKTTSNNQHIVFKSKLTLSDELIACQLGNETYYFGLKEAISCIEDMRELIKKYPVTKSHLIPNPQPSEPFARFRKEAQNKEALKEISDFYKRYCKDVRAGAFILLIGDDEDKRKGTK